MSSRRSLIPVFVILTFLAQMAMPAVARADDGIPPEPVATEVPVEPGTGEEPPQSVPEILAQVPQGTDIAVENPDGEPEPLATLAAEDTIASSDPVWCPSTVTDPSDGSCTPGQASITALIDFLEDNAATYYGDGTIFFQAGVYTDTELSIILLSDAYDYDLDSSNDLGALGALKIYGGWDLDSASLTYGDQIAGGTTFNLPIQIDWLSDLTIQDVVVDSDYGGYSLQISSGGNITLTGVDVVDNASGSGAYLDACVLVDINPDPDITEWACSGTGTVTITGSDFDGNTGDGLWVESIGSITLNTVSASDNGLWGAGLDNSNGTGSILIGTSQFDNNGSQGLAVWSDHVISIDHISAGGNYDGAQFMSLGAVSLTSSTFNANAVEGLDVWSVDGPITLTSVDVIGTVEGSGAYVTAENGDIDVYGGNFNDNNITGASIDDGNFGIGLAAEAWNGSVTLSNVTANGNDVGVVALAFGGDVLVTGDTDVEDTSYYSFSNNSQIGIGAWAQDGTVTLVDVTAEGNGSPGGYGYGAWLIGYNSPILVSGGVFDGNLQKGVYIESDGMYADVDVTLDGVEASENEAKGVYITYAAPCGTTTGGVDVNVIGGLYQTNGAYGIYGMLGPEGMVTLDSLTPPDFGLHNGNPPDSLYDLLVNTDVVPCPPPCEPKPEVELKPYHVVEVPETGGLPVEQNCIEYSGTLLILPGQDKVLLPCPAAGSIDASQLTVDQLPGPIPGGPEFLAALEITLLDEDQQPIAVLPDGGFVSVGFKVPEDARPNDRFSILYWDPGANNGAGAWFELPQYRETIPGRSTSFPLHPELVPDDLMRILSGVRSQGGYIKANVNFPGIFALIRR